MTDTTNTIPFIETLRDVVNYAEKGKVPEPWMAANLAILAANLERLGALRDVDIHIWRDGSLHVVDRRTAATLNVVSSLIRAVFALP